MMPSDEDARDADISPYHDVLCHGGSHDECIQQSKRKRPSAFKCYLPAAETPAERGASPPLCTRVPLKSASNSVRDRTIF